VTPSSTGDSDTPDSDGSAHEQVESEESSAGGRAGPTTGLSAKALFGIGAVVVLATSIGIAFAISSASREKTDLTESAQKVVTTLPEAEPNDPPIALDTTPTTTPTTTSTTITTTTTIPEPLVEPLVVPTGLTVVYITCTRVESETNLNVAALELAVDGIGGVLTSMLDFDCDDHRGEPLARELIGLDADLYLVGGATRSFLDGTFYRRAGSSYPPPLDDLSRIFESIPLTGNRPQWVTQRELTAYETWIVLDQALRWILEDASDSVGTVNWAATRFGPNPDDRSGFMDGILDQWGIDD